MTRCALRLLVPLAGLVVLPAAALTAEGDRDFSLVPTKVGHELRAPDGRTVFQYMTVKPEGSELTANSTCCLYPVHTPKGIGVVEFAPEDHRHHRGIFLAWHNIQGNPGGDFWGWGKFAPTEGRVIRNRSVTLTESAREQALLTIVNDWVAGENVIMAERTSLTVRELPGAFLLDLHYALTPASDLTLGRSAFSGFNVKSRKVNGVYTGPNGPVDLPNPHHLKPGTDWPTQPWYDYSFTLEDGTQAGVTVIDHKDNPPTTWHNLLPIAMLNPCIVAPAEVTLPAGKTLDLRYRLLVHDGPVPAVLVKEQAVGFARR